MTATSAGAVPRVEREELSFTRRKLVAFLAILALLLAATVVTAPPASAGFCGHEDHDHWHNGHMDWYHWHDHYNEHGFHWHTWHNHTHGDIFTVRC